MLEAQRRMRAQKAQLAKDLKNAQRRRSRLKHKAKLLSASDLASVLVLRQEEEQQRQAAAAKRRRSSQPVSRAGASAGVGDRPANSEELTEDDDSVGGDEQEGGDSADPPALT